MSVPVGPDAGECRVPGGLLEKLMAVVRPEFRADVLAFDAADPVFGGPACMVGGCGRPSGSRGPRRLTAAGDRPSPGWWTP